MEQILYSISEYKLLAMVAGFVIVGVETFIPMIPLLAIIIANAFIFGMWIGFIISWTGSSTASVFLYYVANRFSKAKIFRKYKDITQTKKMLEFIKKQGFNTIFISYACPFIPDFLVTITSGFVGLDIKSFISGMVCGKFVMFLLISYIGEDVGAFFSNPIKIILFAIVIMASWIIGNRVNNKIHETDIKNKEYK